VVTVLELIEVTFQGACTVAMSSKEAAQHSRTKKSPNSNHVAFKSVDTADTPTPDGTLRITQLPMTSLSSGHPRTMSNVPSPSRIIPKVKIDATFRNKHGRQKAETDI